MTPLQRRRLRNLLLTLPPALLVTLWQAGNPAIGPGANFVTGWLMLGGVALLMLLNLRKKLPFLPLGGVAAWTQLHLYLGLLVAWLFLLHTRLALPSGMFGTTLYTLFAFTALSGLFGIWLSRILPPKVRTQEAEITFERIPRRIVALRTEMEGLILAAVGQSGQRALAELYEAELRRWMGGPADRWAHLVGSTAPGRRVFGRVREQERYLSLPELEALRPIHALLREKLLLDRTHARLWMLRRWLLLHLPTAYVLALFAVLHLLTVYAFVGGAG